MNSELRWEKYVLAQGAEFIKLWTEVLQSGDRSVLFITGLGFDPRMCHGIEAILESGKPSKKSCILVRYDEGESSPSREHLKLVDENLKKLQTLFQNDVIEERKLTMWSEDRKRRVGSRQANAIFDSPELLESASDIVIDISSIPRSLYFSIIAKFLHMIDQQIAARKLPTNLHVVVSESVSIDQSITDEGIDEEASIIHGFAGRFEQESAKGIAKVWIPVLGEGKETQLSRIIELVKPQEVCPVIPSPSQNPRRGDNLVMQYREFLFDVWRIEPRNIIFSSECNPFETYRQIFRTVARYNRSLDVLGGCHSAISATSSKLLSVGALLAAYDLKMLNYSVGIPHVEADGYRMTDATASQRSELFSLWLTGECYEN